MDREDLSPEEESLLEFLAARVEEYEDSVCPPTTVSPKDVLVHLMSAQRLEVEDLVGIFGGQENALKVMSGEASITQDQAEALGTLCGVTSALFT